MTSRLFTAFNCGIGHDFMEAAPAPSWLPTDMCGPETDINPLGATGDLLTIAATLDIENTGRLLERTGQEPDFCWIEFDI